MREVIFRGKRKKDGEWVEGNLFIPDKPDTPTQICMGTHTIRICHEIIPETVGEYTGLTDKNGKKIWEGDILVIRNNRQYPVVVKFLDFGWCCVIPNVNAYIDYRHRLENNDTKYEVIGNIHDNSELLKGGADNG